MDLAGLISLALLAAAAWLWLRARRERSRNGALPADRERLLRLSLYDDLTGVANRTLFRDNLIKSLAHAAREQTRLALLYLDLDGFKAVNDTRGHDAGDTVLRLVANRLKSALRADDFVGRLGGDEFAVLIEDVADPGDVANVAEKLIDTLTMPINLGGQDVQVGVSVGIAIGPANGADAQSLGRCADLAMYRAKSRGGNRYQFYSDGLHAEVERRADMEADLRDAHRRGEFAARYEPRFSLAQGRVTGVEASLNWQHPDRGLLPAREFLPLLEQFGTIGAVGEWLLADSCAALRRWLDLPGGADLSLAVHASVVQLADVAYADRVVDTLRAAGIAPERLDVAVSETALMREDRHMLVTLRELEQHGVGIVIDGFGTGGSSLVHLKRLPPVRMLKIDRSLIADVPGSAGDRAVVTAAIALAHSVGAKVIAEGVESEWQKRFLAQAGCDFAQGLHFCPPQPEEAIPALLAAQGAAGARGADSAG